MAASAVEPALRTEEASPGVAPCPPLRLSWPPRGASERAAQVACRGCGALPECILLGVEPLLNRCRGSQRPRPCLPRTGTAPGRDAAPSECLLYYAKRDVPRILQLLHHGKRSKDQFQREVALVKQVAAGETAGLPAAASPRPTAAY